MVPTLSQIKAQVALVRRQVPDASRIALAASGQWLGEPSPGDDALTYRIQTCPSPLAIRLALRENLPPRTVQVILTPLDSSELSDDILLRLAKRRVFPLDPWQMALSLFQAQTLDPRLRSTPWLADYLLETAPSQGYGAAVSGFLAAETVWSQVLRQLLNLNSDRPDLLTLLHWSLDPQNLTRYQGLTPDQQTSIDAWLIANGGKTVAYLLKVFQSSKPEDSLALGLVLPALYGPQVSQGWDRAMGKLEERYFLGASPDAWVVERWSQAAKELLASRLIDDYQHQRLVARADEIFAELGAGGATYWSVWSPAGFEDRLSQFGQTLQSLFTNPTLDLRESLKAQFQFLGSHHQAHNPHSAQRWRRLQMAFRLAGWWIQYGAGEDPAPSSLEAAIRQEIQTGSFLDWSRLKLPTGDVNPELAGAYRLILSKMTQIREEQAYNFACLLQRAVSFNHFEAGILLIEDVLEKIVAPIAKTQPALILIFDGMSLAAARELLTDLISQGQWTLRPRPQGETGIGAALGALPSITAVCRSSLLSGQLQGGDASLEKKRFSSHPLLLSLCSAKYPPRLFHKQGLNPQDGSATEEVCAYITDRAHKIVAVVINAMDDALLKSDQLELDWTLASVKPLAALLHSARLAQREVIVLSDHGHVLELNTTSEAGEDGERWRQAQGSTQESELLITGARVLRPESKTLIAPWSETLRYGVKKNGYHGGVNPQETLAPAFILSPTDPSSPPRETLLEEPDWWSLV